MSNRSGPKWMKHGRLWGFFVLAGMIFGHGVIEAAAGVLCCNPAHAIDPTAPAGNNCNSVKGKCLVAKGKKDLCTDVEAWQTVVVGQCQNGTKTCVRNVGIVTSVTYYNGYFTCGPLTDGECCVWDYYLPYDSQVQNNVLQCVGGSCNP